MNAPLDGEECVWTVPALDAADGRPKGVDRGRGMSVDGEDPVSRSEARPRQGTLWIEGLENDPPTVRRIADLRSHDHANGPFDRRVGQGSGGEPKLDGTSASRGLEGEGTAWIVGGEVSVQIRAPMECPAVDAGEQVVCGEADAGGRAVRVDPHDADGDAASRARAKGDVFKVSPQPGYLDRTELYEVPGHLHRPVDGDGKADAATLGVDGGVDPNQAAGDVEEWAAGVARIDARIGLDEVLVDAVIGLEGAGDGRYDAGGHGVAQAEGVADGDDGLAQEQLAGCTHIHGGQGRIGGGRVDPQNREVELRCGADQRGVIAPTIREGGCDPMRASNDVVVRQDDPFGRQDHARSFTAAGPRLEEQVGLRNFCSDRNYAWSDFLDGLDHRGSTPRVDGTCRDGAGQGGGGGGGRGSQQDGRVRNPNGDRVPGGRLLGGGLGERADHEAGEREPGRASAMHGFARGKRSRGLGRRFALRRSAICIGRRCCRCVRRDSLNPPVSSTTARPAQQHPVVIRTGTVFLVACLVWIGLFAPRPADAARRQLTIEEQYELGLKQLKRGYYVKALEQFNRIRNYHRDDPLAVKAELAIADVYFKKHEWDQARDAYEDFLRWHPRYADADYVVYRLGLSMYKKSNRIAARDQTWTVRTTEIWAGFSSRFADSEYSEEVSEKLQECRERLGHKELIIAQFYRRRQSWESVERRASGILANHAATESMPEGMGLLAEARAWQGEASEATALVDKLEALDAREAARARRRISRARPERLVPGS